MQPEPDGRHRSVSPAPLNHAGVCGVAHTVSDASLDDLDGGLELSCCLEAVLVPRPRILPNSVVSAPTRKKRKRLQVFTWLSRDRTSIAFLLQLIGSLLAMIYTSLLHRLDSVFDQPQYALQQHGGRCSWGSRSGHQLHSLQAGLSNSHDVYTQGR